VVSQPWEDHQHTLVGRLTTEGEDVSKPLDFERPFIGLLFQTKEALSDNNLSAL